MIREVQGDILLSQAQVIAHGIATHDPFDSGLALACASAFRRWSRLPPRHARQGAGYRRHLARRGVNEDGSTRASSTC